MAPPARYSEASLRCRGTYRGSKRGDTSSRRLVLSSLRGQGGDHGIHPSSGRGDHGDKGMRLGEVRCPPQDRPWTGEEIRLASGRDQNISPWEGPTPHQGAPEDERAVLEINEFVPRVS